MYIYTCTFLWHRGNILCILTILPHRLSEDVDSNHCWRTHSTQCFWCLKSHHTVRIVLIPSSPVTPWVLTPQQNIRFIRSTCLMSSKTIHFLDMFLHFSQFYPEVQIKPDLQGYSRTHGTTAPCPRRGTARWWHPRLGSHLHRGSWRAGRGIHFFDPRDPGCEAKINGKSAGIPGASHIFHEIWWTKHFGIWTSAALEYRVLRVIPTKWFFVWYSEFLSDNCIWHSIILFYEKGFDPFILPTCILALYLVQSSHTASPKSGSSQ